MSFKVIKLRDVKTEKILGGPIKVVVDSGAVGSKNLMFALGAFNAGEGLVPHLHPQSEEVYYVIRGKGTVYVGKERQEVHIEPNMALFIPPATIHAVRNTGQQQLVIGFFLAPGTEAAEEMVK